MTTRADKAVTLAWSVLSIAMAGFCFVAWLLAHRASHVPLGRRKIRPWRLRRLTSRQGRQVNGAIVPTFRLRCRLFCNVYWDSQLMSVPYSGTVEMDILAEPSCTCLA